MQQECTQSHIQHCLITPQCQRLDLEPGLTLPTVQEERRETNTKLQYSIAANNGDENLSPLILCTPNYFRKSYDSGIGKCHTIAILYRYAIIKTTDFQAFITLDVR